MPIQRITIAKLGGKSAEVALQRLGAWSAARTTNDSITPAQWPPSIRHLADSFAERLRANAVCPPVLYFLEWVDMWSMGDLFVRWLTPPNCPGPIIVHADRFEIYACRLPDEGRLARHLSVAGPQQFTESDQFVGRLREAVSVWEGVVDRAALIVLRQVVGGSASDEEVAESLRTCPAWLF